MEKKRSVDMLGRKKPVRRSKKAEERAVPRIVLPEAGDESVRELSP